MRGDIKVCLRGRTAELVEEIAWRRGSTVAEVLSQALSHEALVEQTLTRGGEVLLVDAHGHGRRLVIERSADPLDLGETTVELLLPDPA